MFDSERAPSLSFAFKRKILAESRKTSVAVFSSQRPPESFGGRGYSGETGFILLLLHLIFLSHLWPRPQAQVISDVSIWCYFLRGAVLQYSGFLGSIKGTCALAETTGRQDAWVLTALSDLKPTIVDPMSHFSHLPTQRRVWPRPPTSHPQSGEGTSGDSQTMFSVRTALARDRDTMTRLHQEISRKPPLARDFRLHVRRSSTALVVVNKIPLLSVGDLCPFIPPLNWRPSPTRCFCIQIN